MALAVLPALGVWGPGWGWLGQVCGGGDGVVVVGNDLCLVPVVV